MKLVCLVRLVSIVIILVASSDPEWVWAVIKIWEVVNCKSVLL